MRRHPLIKKLQKPYCLFLWSFLWWGKNISSRTPIWFLRDCTSPLKARACNQSFLPFEIPKEIATCRTVFSHLWTTWFYDISHGLSSRAMQALSLGRQITLQGVAGLGSSSAGGAGALEQAAGPRSVLQGMGLSPSTLCTWDHGQIQGLVLGPPQYRRWTNWWEFSRGSKPAGAGAVVLRGEAEGWAGSAWGRDGSGGAGSGPKPNYRQWR